MLSLIRLMFNGSVAEMNYIIGIFLLGGYISLSNQCMLLGGHVIYTTFIIYCFKFILPPQRVSDNNVILNCVEAESIFIILPMLFNGEFYEI